MQQPKLTLDALGKLDDFLSGRVDPQRVKPRSVLTTAALMAAAAGLSIQPSLHPGPSPKSVLPPKEYAAAKAKKRAQRVARRKNRR